MSDHRSAGVGLSRRDRRSRRRPLGIGLAVCVSALVFAAAALAAAGDLDPSFDGDGIVLTDMGGENRARAVAVQADGKIVAVGGKGAGAGGVSTDLALARYNADGSLDSSFSGDGKATTDISGPGDIANAVALQPDGKIVVAGLGRSSGVTHVVLARYNADGSLDTGFSGDGKVTTKIGDSSSANAVAIQPDGKIVVAGTAHSPTSGNLNFALARYTPTGALDSSFDGNGLLTTDFGEDDYGQGVGLQPDGKIVVAGFRTQTGDPDFALARYNPDGALDSSFDGNGLLATDFGSESFGRAVALQADGKIVVAGEAGDDFALARYNTNGALDSAFDADGRLTTDFGSEDSGNAVALQANGKILAAGRSNTGNDADFALARYDSNGVLDPTFSGDGMVTTSPGASDSAFGVALQPDGKIVAAGDANTASAGDFAVARYEGDPVSSGGGDSGSGGGGSGSGSGGGVGSAAPVIDLGGKQKQKLGRFVTVKAGCEGGCLLEAEGKLIVSGKSKGSKQALKAKRAGLKEAEGSSSGPLVKLKLKLKTKARKLGKKGLRKGSKVKAKLTVTATNAVSGASAEAKRKVRLRKKK